MKSSTGRTKISQIYTWGTLEGRVNRKQHVLILWAKIRAFILLGDIVVTL